jgi:hypothetical protein
MGRVGCSGPFSSLLRICRTLLSGCWVDSGLVGTFLLGGLSGSCLFLGRLSLACCATVVRLVVVGCLCERITRGCMASFCMVGMAVDCGAWEVAGDGLCGAAGLVWLGVQLRGGAWVASGLVGSCLVLGLLSLAWCLGSGALSDAERNVRPFVAGVSGLIGCLVLGHLSLAWRAWVQGPFPMLSAMCARLWQVYPGSLAVWFWGSCRWLGAWVQGPFPMLSALCARLWQVYPGSLAARGLGLVGWPCVVWCGFQATASKGRGGETTHRVR